MPQIGAFSSTNTGFRGRVRTLTLDVEIVLVAREGSDADKAPDYRIHARDEDGAEVGAGWKHAGEKAGDYVSLQLDDPSFSQPVRANLFRSEADGDRWTLHWSRSPKRSGRT